MNTFEFINLPDVSVTGSYRDHCIGPYCEDKWVKYTGGMKAVVRYEPRAASLLVLTPYAR